MPDNFDNEGLKADEVPEQELPGDPESLKTHFINQTIEAGVNPIEMRFSEISKTYPVRPIAYRSFTYLNSVVTRESGPTEYGPETDGTEEGLNLAKWNITHALRYARLMQMAGREISFITARVPAEMCLKADLYEIVKGIAAEQELDPKTICIEFPPKVLRMRKKEDREKVRKTFLDMQILGVKTMVTGIGIAEFSLLNLFEIPADYFLLEPALTAMSDSRSKGRAVEGFVGCLRKLPADVIADGVYNDKQITALARMDVAAYIPSSGYQGRYPLRSLRMTFEEAVRQGAEEEE